MALDPKRRAVTRTGCQVPIRTAFGGPGIAGVNAAVIVAKTGEQPLRVRDSQLQFRFLDEFRKSAAPARHPVGRFVGKGGEDAVA